MTDKPARTMLLTPYEWRALVSTGVNNIYSFIGAMHNPVPDHAELVWFNDALDRLKMQVSAWGASGQPQPAQTEKTVQWSQQQDPTSFTPSADMNGTGEARDMAAFASNPAQLQAPKKKRGWQKGRKRGPRKPKGNEAVQ